VLISIIEALRVSEDQNKDRHQLGQELFNLEKA